MKTSNSAGMFAASTAITQLVVYRWALAGERHCRVGFWPWATDGHCPLWHKSMSDIAMACLDTIICTVAVDTADMPVDLDIFTSMLRFWVTSPRA